jgi:hypothetical protein
MRLEITTHALTKAGTSYCNLRMYFSEKTQTLPSGSAAERAALLDLPLLADAPHIAGLDDYRGEAGVVLFEVEALANDRIDDLTRNRVGPPLCAGPVAIEHLDDRSVRRSATSNARHFLAKLVVPRPSISIPSQFHTWKTLAVHG